MIGQTEVYQRLAMEIERIPAIDAHVHLNPRAPLAQDLAEVLYYGNYLAELIGAGAPAELMTNAKLPPRERVAAIVPELRRSPYSIHAWMLRELLSSAYGFRDDLTEENWPALFDQVAATRARPGRFREICRMARVSKILVHLPPRPLKECVCDDEVFVGLSDLRVPEQITKAAIEHMEKQTGDSIHSARQMRDAMIAYVKRGAQVGQRGLAFNFIPKIETYRPGEPAIAAAFDKIATGKPVAPDEASALAIFARDAAATAAAETGMVVQLYVKGSDYGGVHLPSAEQKLMAAICEFIAAYPKVNFIAQTVSAEQTQNLTLCAKHLPNFYVGGVWWFAQFPEFISSAFALRMEILPPSKWSAFFSDAYVAEWMIGKTALIRKELVRTLAVKVVAGYMAEEHALFVAREVLLDMPRRLYRLGE